MPAMIRGKATHLRRGSLDFRAHVLRSLRAFDSGGQARKGAWGMSRRQEAVKGAEDCDKPGVTVKQVMIPGCPNWLQLNS